MSLWVKEYCKDLQAYFALIHSHIYFGLIAHGNMYVCSKLKQTINNAK